MSISNSRLAYQDCRDLFERAMADPRGARLLIGKQNFARFFVLRMHKCRTIERADNAKVYPIGDPMHGASDWDQIKCSIKEDSDGHWWVYAEKVELDLNRVESLSEIEGEYTEIETQIEKQNHPQLAYDPRRKI